MRLCTRPCDSVRGFADNIDARDYGRRASAMLTIIAPLMLGVAAVIASLLSLIWSLRRIA